MYNSWPVASEVGRPSLRSSVLEPRHLFPPRTTKTLDETEIARRPPVALVGSESEILLGLQQGEPLAQTVFFDQHEGGVRRVLVRILGTSPDVADALQDTFLRAFSNASQVKDSAALRSWLLRVAVSVAFDQLRRRRRLRWLVFSGEPPTDVAVEGASAELRDALRDTYRVMDRLPHEERIAFALRHIDEMELDQIADACKVSLSTVKRRLNKAEIRFRTIASRVPSLVDWMNEEARS
jgi:RNA polymerase sigma-70 factor, ECF subfamily